MTPHEDFGVCVITSVGFLVDRNKDRLVLARDSVDGEWRGIMTIPTENIVKVRTR